MTHHRVRPALFLVAVLALLAAPLAAEDGAAAPAAAPAPAAPAAPAATVAPAPGAVTGPITAIAAEKHSVTIRPKTGDPVTVTVDDKTTITRDGKPATFADLKLDDTATATRDGERLVSLEVTSSPDSGKATKGKHKKKKKTADDQ